MNEKTPRTDAAQFHIGTSGPFVWASEMQKIERELAAAGEPHRG